MGAHIASMAQNGGPCLAENGGAVTAAILIIGDEILKVRSQQTECISREPILISCAVW